MDKEIHGFAILEPDSNLINPFIEVFSITIANGMANVSHKRRIGSNDRLDGKVGLFVCGVLLWIIVSVGFRVSFGIDADIVNRPGVEQYSIGRIFRQPLV